MDKSKKEKVLRVFGENISQIIENSEFKTAYKFSKKTGFQKSEIYGMMAGERDVKLTTLVELAKLLNVSVQDLVKIPAKHLK